MPWEWHELLNPVIFVSFAVWLFMELAIAACIVLFIGLPLLGIANGIYVLIQSMRGKG